MSPATSSRAPRRGRGSWTPPSFSFTAMDPTSGGVSSGVAGTECRLDLGSWVTCSSGVGYSVTEGSQTFSVRATDNAGNVETSPASFTWLVDTSAPSSAAGAPAYSTMLSITVTYSASDAGSPPSGLADVELWVKT